MTRVLVYIIERSYKSVISLAFSPGIIMIRAIVAMNIFELGEREIRYWRVQLDKDIRDI